MDNSRVPCFEGRSYELSFRSLFKEGRGYAFPCDAEGHVDMDELTAASHKMAEKMYQAASAQPGAGAQPGAEAPKAEEPKAGKKGDPNVVDAEFEESN